MPLGNLGDLHRLALAETGSQASSADTNAPDTAGTPGTAATPGAENTGAPSGATAKNDEVVYGLLKGDGTPKQSYVVNHFVVDKPTTLTDFGNYSAVSNLSSTESLATNGDKVSIPAKEGDFYYQGTLSKNELPWIIGIEYTLDGVRTAPEQLAGKSGKLEINIKTAQNTKADPVFFENYLLQIQLTLDSNKTKALRAEGATIASAGKDHQIAFMVMPKKQGDLKLSVQVSDFEMPSIQISGLPFSMVFEVPDTTKIVDDMSELSDAIGTLNDGVAELKEGMSKLTGGSADLKTGSKEVNTALSKLNSSGAKIRKAAKEIDSALAEIAKQMNTGSIDPKKITELVSGLRQLSLGLSNTDPKTPGLSEGLKQVQGGIDSSVAAMDGYMAALKTVDAASIGGLLTDPGLAGLSAQSQATVQRLVDTNTNAAYVLGAWYGPGGNDGVKAGLSASSTGLSEPIEAAKTMSGQLTTIADGLEENLDSLSGLSQLASYMKQLSKEFTTFKDGVVTYTEGVGTLAKSYSDFDDGLKQYLNGTNELYGGLSSLRSGTDELYINVKDLPQTMQDEIDSFLEDYKSSDFEPKSFVSDKNTDVQHVQFVMVSDAIKIPEPPAASADSAPAEQNIWDRLLALFK
jgi:X-X-X-Leu-X-X-Gly heptad repeat protein